MSELHNLVRSALFALIVGVLLFLFLRVQDHENYDKRIQRLEILACSFTQFEDFSVTVQDDDRSRRLCVDYILGRIDCDRVTRGDNDYLVNCREK